MKELLLNVSAFIALALLFSSCGEPTGSANAPAPEVNRSDPKIAGSKSRSSEYPPLGEKVASADMKHLDGTTSKVSDRKGKVVLLNMWATWCGPCRAEMPSLVRMQDEYRDRDFEVIGLNSDDETVEQINKFAADMKLNYTIVWADTSMQSELLKISKFGGIPQSFLIDRNGHLRGVFTGASPSAIKKMEEMVAEVVAEEG